MMENRSFDHMLGYLKRDGMADVDGLNGDEFNLDKDGTKVAGHGRSTPMPTTSSGPARRCRRGSTPTTRPRGVATQLGRATARRPISGFVKALHREPQAGGQRRRDLWMVPMGYYTAKDVPVYDHFARQYCVCDGWHSSIPATPGRTARVRDRRARGRRITRGRTGSSTPDRDGR